MKDTRIAIRVDDKFKSKLEYLKQIHGFKTIADTIRKIIEKEYRKECNEPLCCLSNNQVHLCKSCSYCYPDCQAENKDICFGDGIGDDNICACAKYDPLMERDIYRQGI